jgi:hypothetical protein
VKRLTVCLRILSVLTMAVACAAGQMSDASYSSQKPVYAKVALAEDGSGVLSVVFDESKGTGNGYDVLYADTDFNGAFEEAEKVTAKSWKCSPTGLHCDFPPVKVSVAPKSEALGKTCDCGINFSYSKHTYTTEVTTAPGRTRGVFLTRVLTARRQKAAPAVATTTLESFRASSKINVSERSDQWEYSSVKSIKPSEKPAEAPMWNFLETPKLALTCKPNDRVKGNLGIGFELMAGETRIEGKKGTVQLRARVEVRKSDGSIVHKNEGPASRYGFG